MARKVADTTGKSFIRTGGEWVDGRCGNAADPCVFYRAYGARRPCDHWIYGHYEGGTREPGRFTSKLAPMPRVTFPEPAPASPAIDYSTPDAVTRAARGAGHSADFLPIRGEELGVKFLKALRALGEGWERDTPRFEVTA